MAAAPIIQRQAQLISAVEEVARSRKFGQRLQTEINEHLAVLRAAMPALEKLDEILDLNDLDNELGGRRQNLQFWQSFASGRYSKIVTSNPTPSAEQTERAATLEALYRTKSLTLNALYKASLEFNGVTVFSEEDLRFSRDIGEKFNHLKRTWEQFKRRHQQRQSLHFKSYSYRPVKDFLDILRKHNLIESYSFTVKRRDSKEEFIDQQGIERLTAKRPPDRDSDFYAAYDGLNTKRMPLVTGGWFEVFTYVAFNDMLTRLDGEYEIYSRVEFEAKEMMKDKIQSDFDILVGLPDQIVMAECKSGVVNRDVAFRMIENSRLLQRIFGKMGVQKYLFLLIFSPSDDASQNSGLDDLRRQGFTILEPHNVAPYLSAYIQNQTPADGLVWTPPRQSQHGGPQSSGA